MIKYYVFYILCLSILGSCVPASIVLTSEGEGAAVVETSSPRPTRTLFATFSASPKPLETSTPTPQPTGTPTITPTATATPTPTSTVPPEVAMATPTMGPSGSSNCTVYADQEGLPIYPDPSANPFRVWPTLELGIGYEAVSIYPTLYQLRHEGISIGWVDYRLIGVRSEGDGCWSLPQDDRPLTDFPTICIFSPNGPIGTFLDPDMTEPYHFELIAGAPQVVIVKFEESLLASVGHAMSYYIAREDGVLSEACDEIPRGGRMTSAAELWSEPNGRNGEPGIAIPEGIRVYVQPGEVQGPGIGPDSGEVAWVRVMAAVQGRPVGWVPAAWVEYD